MYEDHQDDTAPDTPLGPAAVPDEAEADALRSQCDGDRTEMAPHDTADCAGLALADQYENEEDGGS